MSYTEVPTRQQKAVDVIKFVLSVNSLTVTQNGTLSVLEIYSDASENTVYQDSTSLSYLSVRETM